MEVQLKYKSLFEKGKHTEAIQLLMKQKDQFDPAIYHYNLGVNLAFVNELHCQLQLLPLLSIWGIHWDS